VKLPPQALIARKGRVGADKIASGTIPAWVLLIVAIAIGVAAYTGIQQIGEHRQHATEAVLTVAQLQTLSVKGQLLYQQYLTDPASAETIVPEYEATLSETLSHMVKLGSLSPGPTFDELSAILNRLNLASAQDPARLLPASERTIDDTYLNTVILPIAKEFFDSLDRAQLIYNREARVQEEKARVSTLTVVSVAVLLIGGLFLINERLRKAKSAIIERQELRFRALVQHGTDLISLIDKYGRIQFQSPSIQTLLGRAPGTVDRQPFVSIVHSEDVAIFTAALVNADAQPETPVTTELRLLHDNGTWRTVEIVISNLIHNPAVHGYVMTSRDVTLRNELAAQIAHAASHDPLTGLPNRRLLIDRLAHGMERANRSGEDLAVIFTDLDGFKLVNDTQGHDAGDELLKQVAVRIKQSIRPGDSLARLGGDEFVIVLESAGTFIALEVADRISHGISGPFHLSGRQAVISTSLGISVRESPFDTPEDLLRRADKAMYESKRGGHSTPVIYDESMESDPIRHLAIEDLTTAVASV